MLRYYINYHPITISKLWTAAIRAGDRFAGHPAVYTVHFEELVLNPEEVVPRICEFVGISYDGSLLEVPQIGSSSVVDRPERKGINPERAGSWRKGGLNRSEIFLCQKVAGSLMQAHDYELAGLRPNVLRLLYYSLSLPLKLTLAVFVNLKRMRNMREAVRRRLS